MSQTAKKKVQKSRRPAEPLRARNPTAALQNSILVISKDYLPNVRECTTRTSRANRHTCVVFLASLEIAASRATRIESAREQNLRSYNLSVVIDNCLAKFYVC